MNTSLDAVFVFALLAFLQLWGGLALGAGIRGRRLMPILWGLLIGAAPLYLGVERGLVLGSWLPLAGQLAVLLLSAAWVILRPSRLREAFPDLPAQPDAKTGFVKLRELRNQW